MLSWFCTFFMCKLSKFTRSVYFCRQKNTFKTLTNQNSVRLPLTSHKKKHIPQQSSSQCKQESGSFIFSKQHCQVLNYTCSNLTSINLHLLFIYFFKKAVLDFFNKTSDLNKLTLYSLFKSVTKAQLNN